MELVYLRLEVYTKARGIELVKIPLMSQDSRFGISTIPDSIV